MREVSISRRGPIKQNSAVFSAFLFYREAFCYFQEANLFHYIFLKTYAVMCEVIQLLYSNECTRDQDPFNGKMRTGTGPALVRGIKMMERALKATERVVDKKVK